MTQKLYTEEQVHKIINELVEDATPLLVGEILSEYDPIELPSNKEIKKEANQTFEKGADYIMHPQYEMWRCFILGAKWMRDKIQGGNK